RLLDISRRQRGRPGPQHCCGRLRQRLRDGWHHIHKLPDDIRGLPEGPRRSRPQRPRRFCRDDRAGHAATTAAAATATTATAPAAATPAATAAATAASDTATAAAAPTDTAAAAAAAAADSYLADVQARVGVIREPSVRCRTAPGTRRGIKLDGGIAGPLSSKIHRRHSRFGTWLKGGSPAS